MGDESWARFRVFAVTKRKKNTCSVWATEVGKEKKGRQKEEKEAGGRVKLTGGRGRLRKV